TRSKRDWSSVVCFSDLTWMVAAAPGLPSIPSVPFLQLAAPGKNGTDGIDGNPGAAATIQVGEVVTLEPGQPAAVENTGTEQAAEIGRAASRDRMWSAGV